MISRAASRTSSERPSATSLRPSINAFSFSRVRSDAGILSIGVLLRRGRSPNRTSLGFAYQARVHPNPFSSNLRTSPVDQPPEGTEWLHELKFDGYGMHAVWTGV